MKLSVKETRLNLPATFVNGFVENVEKHQKPERLAVVKKYMSINKRMRGHYHMDKMPVKDIRIVMFALDDYAATDGTTETKISTCKKLTDQARQFMTAKNDRSLPAEIMDEKKTPTKEVAVKPEKKPVAAATPKTMSSASKKPVKAGGQKSKATGAKKKK